jgi:hypothetical protein
VVFPHLTRVGGAPFEIEVPRFIEDRQKEIKTWAHVFEIVAFFLKDQTLPLFHIVNAGQKEGETKKANIAIIMMRNRVEGFIGSYYGISFRRCEFFLSVSRARVIL